MKISIKEKFSRKLRFTETVKLTVQYFKFLYIRSEPTGWIMEGVTRQRTWPQSNL